MTLEYLALAVVVGLFFVGLVRHARSRQQFGQPTGARRVQRMAPPSTYLG